ncbi:MAG: acetyl-CoA carboxylase biotin carboxyl carrier protein [Actinomycetia bacterium]|nr:acetyl-CoA carboxylase biotin carboxyl carrier protein [Actinomycetes bacterium]
MRKIKINDITIRDLFQSIEPRYINLQVLDELIKHIDKIKFDSIEIFGGSAFEKMLQNNFNKSPFQIAEYIKNKLPAAKLQALVGARNLAGMEIYPKDIISRFIKQSVQHGIGKFRVYDTLNDIENLKFTISEIVKNGAICQGTIIYDNFRDIDFYTQMAKELSDEGCSSICIKDVESTLIPYKTEQLFKNLTTDIDKPFYFSVYNLRGLQVSNYYSACMAGCAGFDFSFIPSSYNDFNPSIFPFILSLKDTKIENNLDYLKILELYEWVKKYIYPSIRQDLINSSYFYSNKNQNLVPKWLLTSISHQLNEIGEIDKLYNVLEEVFKIKNEMGNPPLVTPVGQIIGSQAILNNIIADYRWEITNDEIKKLIFGYYGQLPRAVDPDIKSRISGGEISTDVIKNYDYEVENTYNHCASELKGITNKEVDIITYCFFPEETLKFLNNRKPKAAGLSKIEDQKPQPPVSNVLLGETISGKQNISLEAIDIRKIREITDLVESSNIDEIKLEIDGVKISINKKSQITAATKNVEPAAENISAKDSNLIQIKSPIVGTFFRSASPEAPPFLNVGDRVKKGDTICIIEAMKLMNKINSEHNGEVMEILVQNEEAVEYNQVLALIKVNK